MKNTTSNSKTTKRIRPALSPEIREQQLIAAATDLAERQLLEGTASSQVITHYLKLGTKAKQLELAKLENENKLLEAKTEALKSDKRIEELLDNAIKSMQMYSGQSNVQEMSSYDEYEEY